MVRVWKSKALLFCLRDDPLIVLRRQNHVTFIFIKTTSHDLLMQVAYWNPCFKMCSCRKEISASNAAQFCPGLRKPVSHHFGHHIKGSVTFKEDSSMTNYMYIVNSSNIVQWTACEHVICWWKWSYVWPTWNFLLLFPCLVKTYQSLQVTRIKKIITTYRESCCSKNSPVSIRS